MKAWLTWHSARACTALLAVSLSACTVIPLEEDQARRAQRGGDFDAAKFVAETWSVRIAKQLQSRAVDYEALAPRLTNDLDAAGKAHGRQTADGSPWYFIVKGEATVTSIVRDSRAGTVSIAPVSGGDPVTVLIGPVILSSALRDALPMFDFNDFTDQLSFAAVNKALNQKALAANSATLDTLKIGDRVRFVGALSMSKDAPARTMLPIRIEPFGG